MLQIGRLKGQTVQLGQGEGVYGVVLQLAGVGRLPVSPPEKKAVLPIRHVVLDKPCRLYSGFGAGFFAQNPSGPREGDDRPGVPAEQHLVILVKPGAAPAVLTEPLQPAVAGRKRRFLPPDPVRDAFSFKISLRGDPIKQADLPAVGFAEETVYLTRGENVIFPLYAVAVCILSAVESPGRIRQFPEDIGGSAAGGIRVFFLSRGLIGIEAGREQQGVVIQHLFEVRDQPFFIGGVTRKTAAELVLKAASGHGPQRGFRHGESVRLLFEPGIPHQKKQIVRRGKFRRLSKAAPHGVELSAEEPVCLVQQRLVRFPPAGWLLLPDRVCEPFAGPQKLRAVVFPERRYPREEIDETRLPVTAVFWKIRPGKKRLLLRRHENGEGPAARTGERLAGRHIHGVDIRAFLPVHLDRNEFPVEQLRRFRILKGFVRHHMAPVAGGIADAQKHRLVLGGGFPEGVFPPGVPIYRIACVLEQVRRLFGL